MTLPRALAALLLALIAAAPLTPMGGQYVLHVLVQIFIWSFIAGAWSLMGRFRLVSLGHGAFLGVGAYTGTLLWNFFGVTPWLGALAAVAGAVAIAFVVGYPSYRLRVVGHYFALVTLAVSEVVRLLIIAERGWTGGSLGLTLRPAPAQASLLAMQFADKRVFYYASVAVWLAGLYVWHRLDRSMARSALEAIGEDEAAAAAASVGGVLYAQYVTYVSPETLSGIGVSLRIVFAAVLGGMYSLLGPTVGTALTIALSESLRVTFGIRLIGMAETIYGLVLIVFIIFLPAGLYGGLRELVLRRAAARVTRRYAEGQALESLK